MNIQTLFEEEDTSPEYNLKNFISITLLVPPSGVLLYNLQHSLLFASTESVRICQTIIKIM